MAAASLYIYVPTKGVSAAFAVLFTVSGIHHLWENNIKRRSWRIGFFFPWAALLFAAGFILREYGAFHPDHLGVFISTSVLLFAAPPVYAAADYLVIGRALYYIPYLAPIHPGRVITTFIGLDGIIEAVAANGAALASNVENPRWKIKLGVDLIKASLILLLAAFVLFVLLIVVFHRRCIRAGMMTRNLRIIIYTQYVSCALIILRNIVRTVMFYSSWHSVVNREEAIFWVLEVLPMFINTAMMNVLPPTKYLPTNHKVYLAKDGKTELQGPGWVDKRPFLVTLFDPMDLAGLVMKKDRKDRFWEHDGIGGPKEEAAPVGTSV